MTMNLGFGGVAKGRVVFPEGYDPEHPELWEQKAEDEEEVTCQPPTDSDTTTSPVFGTTNGITLSSTSTTSASFASAPAFPTIASPNYAVIIVQPDTANEEIIYVTAFTSGGTSATVLRAQEGTSGVMVSGVAWVHGPTALDHPLGPDIVAQQVQVGVAAFDLGAR